MRWIKKLIWVVIIAEVAYLVLFNIFLATPWAQRLMSMSPRDVTVRYDRAYTLWPGRYITRGFQCYGEDSHVQFFVALDRGTVEFSLLAALRLTVRATHVSGEGFSLRLRQRLKPSEATPERVARLPVIPNFTSPVTDMEASGPPPTDDHYRLATVDFSDIDVRGVHEVWVDDFRWTGDMHVVHGAFYFKPLRAVSITTTTLDIIDGGVQYGKDVELTKMHGTLNVDVEKFDLREITLDVLHKVSIDGDLAMHFDPAKTINAFLGKVPQVHMENAVGDANVHFAIAHGVMQSGMHAEVRSPKMAIVVPEFIARGAGVAKANVAKGLSLSISVTPFELESARTHNSAVQGKDASMKAFSHELDLTKYPADMDVKFHLGDAQADLRAINPYLPEEPGVSITGGTGIAKGDFAIDSKTQTGTGEMSITSRNASLRSKAARLNADIDIAIKLDKWQLDRNLADFGGSHLRFSHVVARDGSGKQPPLDWEATVEFPTFALDTGKQVKWTSHAQLAMTDIQPLLIMLGSQVSVPGILRKIFNLRHVQASTTLNVSDDLAELRDISVSANLLKDDSADFFVDGRFRVAGKKPTGVLLLKASVFSIGLGLNGEDKHFVLFNADNWYKQLPASRFTEK